MIVASSDMQMGSTRCYTQKTTRTSNTTWTTLHAAASAAAIEKRHQTQGTQTMYFRQAGQLSGSSAQDVLPSESYTRSSLLRTTQKTDTAGPKKHPQYAACLS